MSRQQNNRPKHKAVLLAGHARQRRLSEEEQALWNKIITGIQPLKGRHLQNPPPPPILTQIFDIKEKTHTQMVARPEPKPLRAFPMVNQGEMGGLDKNTAKRLRRGQMDIEANLDLHGMTQEAAFRALSAFIEASFRLGRRCVRIVTGKGLRGEGVLRESTPKWLNSTNLRPMILSFTHAQPRDGGDGALYVLLRRLR